MLVLLVVGCGICVLFPAAPHPDPWWRARQGFRCPTPAGKAGQFSAGPKTYNTGDSLVVTDPTTDPALWRIVYLSSESLTGFLAAYNIDKVERYIALNWGSSLLAMFGGIVRRGVRARKEVVTRLCISFKAAIVITRDQIDTGEDISEYKGIFPA
ncbi:hypothetical protein Micbo1qcDRAFT_176912 [Microdochium bolleyi]|uniref:Uncharacterized protein n=1 Tax=Microdochium bolleyi TaxID=196109 RepID=A0A136IXM7_9PEZI|nr:hypothetical protein Micbo1qcDRAFT_176912 [Microdochium bolleyi]